MKRHTTASCFATFLLPHVLFVADFEERQRIAKVCCLAWNIGLFPDAAERERQTEQVLDMILADAADTAARTAAGVALDDRPPAARTASYWAVPRMTRVRSKANGPPATGVERAAWPGAPAFAPASAINRRASTSQRTAAALSRGVAAG